MIGIDRTCVEGGEGQSSIESRVLEANQDQDTTFLARATGEDYSLLLSPPTHPVSLPLLHQQLLYTNGKYSI